jgi:excisionase family DNA binding protein
MEQPLISLKEAAVLTGLSHSHLRLLARQGRIEAVKMGRDWFTTEKAVSTYLKDEELRTHDPHKYRRSAT